MKRIFTTALAVLLIFLLCFSLVFCAKDDEPSAPDANDYAAAAGRLIDAFDAATAYTLSGSYTFGSSLLTSVDSDRINLSESGAVSGFGGVDAGSLFFEVTMSGTRVEGDESEQYTEEYILSDGEIEYVLQSENAAPLIGVADLDEMLDFVGGAERLEAMITLLPLLSSEVNAVLTAEGVGYDFDDFYALIGETASLYRLLLLRVGEGQILTLPHFSGDAAEVLGEHASLVRDERGMQKWCFSIPFDSILSALYDRQKAFCEISIGQILSQLLGATSVEKILETLSYAQEDTLGELFARLGRELLGDEADGEALYRYFEAYLALSGAESIAMTLRELWDVEALSAFRMLSGDPHQSLSEVERLISAMLSMTVDELAVAMGQKGDALERITRLGDALKSVKLEISYARDDDSVREVDLFFSFSGELEAGVYRSIVYTAMLGLDG